MNSLPNPETLTPLGELTDRRDVAKRLIGPMTTAYTHHILRDTAEPDPAELQRVLSEGIEGDAMFGQVVNPWLDDERSFQTNTEAVFGLARMLGHSMPPEDAPEPAIALGLTSEQETLLKWLTFEIGANYDLSGIVWPTLRAQEGISATMALPAHLIARDEIEDETELLKRLNTIPLPEVYDIMRQPEFLKDIISMSFAPNGTYSNNPVITTLYSDPNLDFTRPLSARVDEELTLEEDMYSPDFPAIHAIEDTLRRIVAKEAPERLRGVLTNFSLYTIFAKRETGTVRLDPFFVKSLRSALTLSNEYEESNTMADIIAPSDGCPANVKVTQLHPEDYTDEQIRLLTEGDEPTATYNAETGELALLVAPIPMLHRYHMKSLGRFVDIAVAR